ncbi:winged helix-turn-helix domain-containing protein [Proteiniclasticum sp. C24MP]|uniref:winged helix-turn-helix domain-containing protein n=1 Tax=Proteiniclasticum sp. C24MP TaxID=3374101 RepID=UPI0037540F6A
MHKILIAGFEKESIMAEVASSENNLEILFSDSLVQTLDLIEEPINTLIIHDEYYKKHKSEFDENLNRNNRIKVFIFNDNINDRHLSRMQNVNYTGYTMKAHDITTAFMESLASFSMDLDASYQYKEITIDYESKQVLIRNEALNLTPMEYDLLVYLKLHSCMTLSRNELIRAVWGYSFLGDSRTIDTHIKSLRRKLGPYRCLVKTVWGKGYKFQEC